MLRGNQGPGNLPHRGGQSIAWRGQGNDSATTSTGERVRGKLGREYVQRKNDSAVQVNKSGISVSCKLRQTQEMQGGAD